MKTFTGKKALLAAAAMLAIAISALPQASAVTYFSMVPGDELCTSVYLGNDGRGEYTMTVTDPGVEDEKPWVDIHFTSLVARPDNVIKIPLCFSTIGRKVGEGAFLKALVKGPSGDQTYEYGICVANEGDVDVTSASGSSPCTDMGKHTDVFTASLEEPEQYAAPGEDVSYTLSLGSSVPATLRISKASGTLQITASNATVDAGGVTKEVTLWMTAPQAAGDYPFTLMVSAEGCGIDDCRRGVSGVLHVTATGKDPAASFFLWLTPATKSVNGVTNADFTLKVKNYGNGQKITMSVSAGDGLSTDFSPYTVFVETDGEKKIPITVLPGTADKKSYKITASATGEDGMKRAAEAWLTVNEMASDAKKLGNDGFEQVSENKGTAVTLDDWASADAATGAVTGAENKDFEDLTVETAPAFNPVLIAAAVAAVACIAALAFVYLRRSRGSDGGYSDLEKSLR